MDPITLAEDELCSNVVGDGQNLTEKVHFYLNYLYTTFTCATN